MGKTLTPDRPTLAIGDRQITVQVLELKQKILLCRDPFGTCCSQQSLLVEKLLFYSQ
ncbi:MAG: hypothetical protein EBE86_015020 [Hormoscilla sp. GUM202]|nr:hypothetical protein [Hormoscilla sp. GUM202]